MMTHHDSKLGENLIRSEKYRIRRKAQVKTTMVLNYIYI